MLLNIAAGIIIIWLIIISWFLYGTIRHYNQLTKNGEKTLKDVLEKLLKNQDITNEEIVRLNKRCDKDEAAAVFHLQKMGLIRFNPFSDTGGNQSFVLSLLDGNNDGVIISSLHSRVQTRWFAKTIRGGKGEEHELSQEEQKAVLQSLRRK